MEPHKRELRGAMAALFTCREREVLLEGRAGTAKTTAILTKILHRARVFPGSRHLICRATRASLTESVLVTLERLLGQGHPEVVRVGREHRHSYELWDSEIVCGGLDKPERLFSTEWDTIYCPEATEIPIEPWELFGRAMRNNRTDYHQRIADCNPGSPAHWLNKRSTPASDALRDSWRTRQEYDALQVYNHHQERDRDRYPMRRLISVHPDNPGYWDFAAWDWTAAGRDFVAELQSMSGHRRARMLDGRWRAAEGTVFAADFDESRNVIEPFPRGVPAGWPQWVGMDPGYDHPCAVLWFAIAPNDTLYIVDEVYGSGKSVEEVAEAIHAHNAGRDVRRYLGDPQHMFSSTQQSPKTIAQQFLAARHPIRFGRWPRTGGGAEAMVEAVRKRLRAQTLKVFATCRNTIAEFQSWSYKRMASGELPAGDDQFEDRDNHAMDVVKGVVATGPRFHSPAGEVVVGGAGGAGGGASKGRA